VNQSRLFYTPTKTSKAEQPAGLGPKATGVLPMFLGTLAIDGFGGGGAAPSWARADDASEQATAAHAGKDFIAGLGGTVTRSDSNV
jgi:hypothetical protein